jgi:hypothetical protein
VAGCSTGAAGGHEGAELNCLAPCRARPHYDAFSRKQTWLGVGESGKGQLGYCQAGVKEN